MFSLPPFLASLRRPESTSCSSPTNEPNAPLSDLRPPLPSLPPELWLLIIRQATLSLPPYRTSTVPSRLAWLASLSLLSGDLVSLAQAELFSSAVVHSLEQLERVIEVLESSLKLRTAVRGLHVRWREREGAEGGAAKGDCDKGETRDGGWRNGVGRVARLVELREVMLSYDGDDEARFDLSWVVVSTKTLLKLTLESVTLKGTSDTLPPFLTLTSHTLRDCTVSPPLTPFLPSLFPSLRSLTLRPTPDTSFHLIQAVLVPFAPQLDSLTWSPSPKATAENGSARAEDGLLLAMLSLCTSLSYLGIPISTLRHLNAGQLPPSLKRLRLRLSRTGDEAKEVLSAVKKLPSTVEVVEMALCGWMSARAGEELLQEVRRRAAGRVRLRHVVGD